MIGWRKGERTRLQHVRQRARIILWIGLNFREGYVAGRLDEFAKRAVGDWRAIHQEAIDGDPMDRCLLGIMFVGAHAERAARHIDHARVCVRG